MCWWHRPATARERRIGLYPRTVADFYADVMQSLAALGIEIRIDDLPNELPEPIRFSEDRTHAAYDPEFAERHWRLLATVEQVMFRFRTGFIGKSSPVHFFWGSFDLAVTRFSGRRAPLHPGGVPHLPDAVAQEAYSHEVSQRGLLAGQRRYPVPGVLLLCLSGAAPVSLHAAIRPAEAFYSNDLSEYILPYEAVRIAADPERALMDFLTSTYEAAASLGKWDRAALDCAARRARRPAQGRGLARAAADAG